MTTEITKDWREIILEDISLMKEINFFNKIRNIDYSAKLDIIEYSQNHNDGACILYCQSKSLTTSNDLDYSNWLAIECLILLYPRLTYLQRMTLERINRDYMNKTNSGKKYDRISFN